MNPTDAVDTASSLQGRRLLVVDDHKNIRVALRHTLEGEGATLDEAETIKDALTLLVDLDRGRMPYDLAILDLRLPDGTGLQVLDRLAHHQMASRALMISGEGTVSDAFRATQLGAFDYIEKPFTPERVLVSVHRCLKFNNIQDDHAELKREVRRAHDILGAHPKVLDLKAMITKVARTQSRVLIVGESGVGKELVAKALHRQSPRASQPFIKVNCAAIPHSLLESELFGHEKGAFTGAVRQRRGLFEQADRGTLLLDEIGELSLDVQAKLLRVLQSGEIQRLGSEKTTTVDVRLLAATHRDLAEMVADQTFREDLYYRLNVVQIRVPPLRDRKSDIPLLAQEFLAAACREHSLGSRAMSPQVLQALESYAWPGNIRELQNVLERAAILADGDTITQVELNDNSSPHPNLNPTHEASLQQPGSLTGLLPGGRLLTWEAFHEHVDREYLTHVLKESRGNVSEAARILCLERAYLHRLMKKLGIHRSVSVQDFRFQK